MRLLTTMLTELRRRRMFRVAGLYILGAWGALQAAGLGFESWDIPASALRYVWIGSVLGFPIAMILGWRYDVVEGRIVRTTAARGHVDLTLRSADYLIITGLTLAIVATIYGIGYGISDTRPIVSDAPVADVDPNAIAVLPFDETSDDDSLAEILAMGLQDDLLTRLSKIRSIHVISRTSVEQYRNADRNMRDIGEDLGVGKIIEGGVTYFNNRVRVNVQLIESTSDRHLWADTYDYDLTAEDLFDVQTEIVESVVESLHTSLTESESIALTASPTDNFDAYTEYLKGKQLSDTESEESISRAIEHYKAALNLDPDFALAHVGIADSYLTLSELFFGNLTSAESIVLAQPHVERALQIDPDSGEAYTSFGLLLMAQQRWQDAGNVFDKAIQLSPNYPRPYQLYAQLHWNFNNRAEAIELVDSALKLDPYSISLNFTRARVSDQTGNFDDALVRYQWVISQNPDYAFAYVYVAAIYYLVYGRIEESLIWYHRAAAADAMSPGLQAAPAFAYLELGDVESAAFWAEQGTERGPNTFWALWAQTVLNVYRNNDDNARQYARQLLEVHPKNSSALRILRDLDVKAGRNTAALLRYQSLYPELFDEDNLEIHLGNRWAAADLVIVLANEGRDRHARKLVDALVATLDTQVRLGENGYWIDDARAYASIGKNELALNRLRTAVDEGWRMLTWYHLDRDPSLASIRDEPEFEEIRAHIQMDLAAQAERLNELKSSGELPLD